MKSDKLAVAARKPQGGGGSVRASTRPEWTKEAYEALDEAIANMDVGSAPYWHELQELSSNTEIDGVFPFYESAVYQNGIFVVPATVAVTLNYGGKRDHHAMPDSYPANIEFEISKTDSRMRAVIKNITVDTSSFYN